MAVVALLGGCALPQVTVIRNQPTPAPQTTPVATEPEPTSTQAAPVPDHPVKKRPGYPYTGANKWRVAPGTTPIRGEAGPVLNYQVAVEQDITGLPVKEFARQVVKILGDERSWVGQGDVRLRRVGPDQAADFTVRLTTPGTRDLLCGGAPDGFTSCRNGDEVVINVARWVHGVKDYPGSLAVYRSYLINHETGHRLGHGHELCPGKGEPAPVMQQQSLGMHGCRANAWPSLKGKPYNGPVGEYADPIPVERTGRQ